MADHLQLIPCDPRSGEEPFRHGSTATSATLLDFWRWAASDLVSNAFRGTLAEYIVALDLGVAHGVCNDWAPYDLDVEGLKIEVKSSAYIQSWAQERLSTPVFSIRQARAWDPTSNQLLPDTRRHSDHYVFALLHCKQQALLDPLDLAQWTFYTLPTAKIDTELGAQKTVRVSTVLRLGAEALRFGEIREALGLSRKDEPL